MKGNPSEESFTEIKAGDKVARHPEELIGDQESTVAELVLQGDAEWLFLAEGPWEHGPLNLSIPAGWHHLSTSPHLPLSHRAICREDG